MGIRWNRELGQLIDVCHQDVGDNPAPFLYSVGAVQLVEKREGDTIVAGTINKSGSILFKAARVSKDTTLAQIINIVKRAQNSKPPISRLADVISAYFVPVVMIIAITSALTWLNFGSYPSLAFAMVSATTVLISACPCALGLATPMSVMVGVGKTAEAGGGVNSQWRSPANGIKNHRDDFG